MLHRSLSSDGPQHSLASVDAVRCSGRQRKRPTMSVRISSIGSCVSALLLAGACGSGNSNVPRSYEGTQDGGATVATLPNGDSASASTPDGGGDTTTLDGASLPPTPTHCSGTPVSTPTATPPQLTHGTWVNISPKSVPFGGNDATNAGDHVFVQGMAMDPCNLATLYVTVSGYNGTTNTVESSGGLYKTTDAGASWTKIGPMDEPLNVRVDPTNPAHLYVGDGVRGATEGFWVSNDGGKTWAIPPGFTAAAKTVNTSDVYHVAPDPTNFNHVLVSFHNPWNSGGAVGDGGSATAGVFESFDGGNTWTAHNPPSGWSNSYGYDVFFLYEPTLGIGDANTWLYGTQGSGYWRTTDSGQTWKQTSMNSMKHGGAQIYYTKEKVLYVTGSPDILQSTDNGATWRDVTPVPSVGFIGIVGDGTTLYTGAATVGPSLASPESDGVKWAAFDSQQFNGSPFEMTYDATDFIVYSAIWYSGVWALKTN